MKGIFQLGRQERPTITRLCQKLTILTSDDTAIAYNVLGEVISKNHNGLISITNPETGERTPIAADEALIETNIPEPEVTLALPLLEKWEANAGPLKPLEVLSAKKPFCMGESSNCQTYSKPPLKSI